ncbi:MAG: Bifunctional protein FolD, Methylenetetrahydrofolate dehydrogenase/Methenyltetrahydrofolate [Candidatus Parcubacteria bacterium]|jgi:methylenetetrahydrofolate dehydrogenase (NADP+)/methenyltetrahydrofolate cyclohydrolase
MIISGKEIQTKYIEALKEKVLKMEHKPVLVIIQIGENKASQVYINQKIKFGKLLGVPVEFYQLEEDVTLEFVQKLIGDFNHDDDICGIIVQLPLPQHLKQFQFEIIDAIEPEKDVDGLTSTNLKRLMSSEGGLVPATAKGIMTMLKESNIEVNGKHVVVVGRSVLVGRSLSQLLLNQDATVTVCHSKTKNLASITKGADIIITATGQPKLITKEHVSEGQTVIDVGITSTGELLEGDVDFEEVSKIVQNISPVPGGVGPMTVLSLFENLIEK